MVRIGPPTTPRLRAAADLASLNAAVDVRRGHLTLSVVAGPALAGVIVVAGSPGRGLAPDAATFALSALILATVTVEHRPAARTQRLRDGWTAFRASDWLWGGATIMSLSNGAFAIFRVVGPVVAINPEVRAIPGIRRLRAPV